MTTTARKITEAAAAHAKARDFLSTARKEYNRLFVFSLDRSISTEDLAAANEAQKIANEKERAADALLRSLCRDSDEHDQAMRDAL